MTPILNTAFVQVALPIIAALALATIVQNKRIDDLRDSINRRLDEIIKRLDKIDAKLEKHEERITRVEERTSPIHRN